MMYNFIKLISLFAPLIMGAGCTANTLDAPDKKGDNLLLGNPSNATTNVADFNNFLMIEEQFALSYSRDKAIPNWVSWHLSPVWRGSADRQDDFRANPKLPAGWYKVQGTDYQSSGFDRGHNCPSADRTKTIADNSATFLMTNMCPQAPAHNQNLWNNLEQYTRKLIDDGNEVYVIMGNYGKGGTGTSGRKTTINSGKITVPAHIFKIIVVLKNGSNDLSRIDKNTRIIAIDTPNDNAAGTDNWGDYRTDIDALEAATGFDFLSKIPEAIQKTLEAKTDTGATK
jgi:endonuclease G